MAEGVSKEKRRARTRRVVSYAVAVVVTAALVGFVYRASRILPRRLARLVNEQYLAGTPFELTVEGISGSLVRRIVLKNAVLRYHSESASYNVFRADEISVTYELLPLLGFRLIVDDVLLRNVAIHLRQDENGKLVIPFPQGKTAGGRFAGASPLVNVRHFTIDGLEMNFGGRKRQLAVRDVNLEGSIRYAKGDARLTIGQGKAYLVDSGKTVSDIRLSARTDGTSVRLDDFAVKLDQSFILANGEFRQGRLDGVELVFNPVSLSELHELGLAPKQEGEFRGKLSLSGAVDSLRIAGRLSGSGFGVDLSDVDFEGLFTPQTLDLARMKGKVFGSGIDGSFRVGLASGDFVFDGRCSDLDLSRGFIKQAGIPPMSLSGRAHVVYTKSKGRYEWKVDLARSVVDGYESFVIRGDGVWEDAKGLRIRSAYLERPGYRVTGAGTVSEPGDVADIVFNAQGSSFGYFWQHFKLPDVEGNLALSGRLQGPLHDFQVNLNGAVHDLEFETFAIDSGSVQAEVRHVGTPAPTVTVSLAGRRGSAAGRWFDSPSILMEVDTSLVRVQTVRFARGDTTVVLNADVKAKGLRSEIDLKRVSITTPKETWTLPRLSRVVIDDGTATIDSLVLASPRGEFGLAGTVRDREHSLDLEVWGRAAKLQLLQDALRLPIRLEGTGDFGVRLYGDKDDPRFDLSLEVMQGVVDSVGFDRLSAEAAFDGTEYRLDRLLVMTGGDSLVAKGAWRCGLSPTRLSRGDSTGVWDAAIALDAHMARYPLGSVFAALHRRAPIAAAFTGKLSVGGTLEEPQVAVTGNIVPGKGPGREFPPARVDAVYEAGKLRITDLSTTQDADIRARGTFPVELSFHRGGRIRTGEPMSFQVDMAPLKGAPAELGRYLDGVSLLRGVLVGSVVGSGTPAVPRLTGTVEFTQGELQVVGLKEGFTDLALKLDFVDDVVRVSSLTAHSDKGSLVGTGWARVSNYRLVDYSVDVSLNNFELRSIPDIETRQDGKMSLRLVQWRDGRRIPSITGALQVREATITMDIAQASTGVETSGPEFTRPTDSPDWIASVDLFAPKNVWVRNPDMTVEMGTEDLILNRDEKGLYFRGELTILRGSYRVYGNKFQITGGLMNFSASETMRPEMLIEAYTPYRTAEGPEQTINLTFSWPHDEKEPKISLAYSEPGYSEADIWKMLGGSISAAGVASNTLERAINQQMTSGVTVDVEQRQIEGRTATSAAERETLVGIGKYLWEDNIYLQYRRGLSIGGEQEVNVEYRLSNRLLLRSQFIYNSQRNRSGITGQNTDEYNLDLKYRFEY